MDYTEQLAQGDNGNYKEVKIITEHLLPLTISNFHDQNNYFWESWRSLLMSSQHPFYSA